MAKASVSARALWLTASAGVAALLVPLVSQGVCYLLWNYSETPDGAGHLGFLAAITIASLAVVLGTVAATVTVCSAAVSSTGHRRTLLASQVAVVVVAVLLAVRASWAVNDWIAR